MKKKSIFSKVGKTVAGFFLIFIVCTALYFSGIAAKLYDGKASSLLSFVVQNSHTGLSTPASQLAINDQDKKDSQFASNTQNKTQNVSGQAVALNGMAPVLFDISAQPVFTRNNMPIILLWISFGVLVLLFLASLAYRAYKKAKLKKIKEN
ncbi:MAG: hypothetical protein NTV36_03330 [Candidatus Staskawiczbacteria bacterium]|nr:hypothetical protein [Candidatus Staskawiczbacteria bacterium]